MTTQAAIDESKAISESPNWDLQFLKIRLVDNVRLIPLTLIESVKGRTFTPEKFYKYQEDQIRYENEGNLLYALTSPKKKIEGYLWAEVSQFDNSLFINTFSISKDYWFKGKAIPKVIEFLDQVKVKHKSPKVFWISTNARFFEKHGFKRSKNVLMEFDKC